MHADKLEYGWWESKRGNVLLPTTLGQKNNYVLTEEELCHLDMELAEMAKAIDKMRANVDNTLRIRRRRSARLIGLERKPICFTIAHVMQLMVDNAKAKLAIIQLLHYIVKQRNPNVRSDGPQQPDESTSSTDS